MPKFAVGIIKILLLVGYSLEKGFSECLMKYQVRSSLLKEKQITRKESCMGTFCSKYATYFLQENTGEFHIEIEVHVVKRISQEKMHLLGFLK